ncbi:MAG: helix-turn-helix domain-containing protein [Mogibacterium diversum]|nr:helix-turn-helix transcriptional regulator [Mogibacterium diversum]MBF1340991.1 helix-turn-helix transcriptional regulator [Mogibacterium diversum]UQF81002.1 MAG: helix-turn-helix domain-containing protein [Mogibacterium diversum]
MTLGEKIRGLRKKQGLSQEDVSRKINVSRQAISKWEQDLVVPDTINLMKLCDCFGITLAELTGDVQKTNTENCDKINKINKSAVTFIVIGCILTVLSVVITFPIKMADFRINGSCFDNELYYLRVFPVNIVLFISILLILVGIVKIMKGTLKK